MIVHKQEEHTTTQIHYDKSDTSSVSEVNLSLERCTRNLMTKVSTHDRFLELELESVTAELKSLKRKYKNKKEHHREEI
jgi:ribosome-associated translation inhibitor RaiA